MRRAHAGVRVLLAVLLGALASLPATASELITRRYTVADGLPVNHTTALAQDAQGALWIGSAAGLARFDGTSFTVIGRGVIRSEVARLVADERGAVFCLQGDGRVHQVQDGRLGEVLGPEGAALTASDLAVVEGRLVVATETGVWAREAAGAWVQRVPDGGVRLVREGPGGSLILGRRGGWSFLEEDGEERTLAPASHPSEAVIGPAGSLWLIDRIPGSLKRAPGADPDRVELVEDVAHHHIHDVVPLERSTWVLHADVLRAVGTHGGEQSWPELGGLDALVDRDGSLWLATYEGVVQIPEPDLRSLGKEDGLPSPVVRYLAVHGSDLWASTWAGTARIEPDGDVHTLLPDGLRGQLCADDQGLLWTFATVPEDDQPGRRVRFFAYDREGNQVRGEVGPHTATHLCGCDRSSDGTVWLLGGGVLYRTRPDNAAPERIGRTPVTGAGYNLVLETSAGELWVASRDQLCHQPVQDVLAGQGGWTCLHTGVPSRIVDLAETGRGQVWIGTRGHGVGRVDGDEVHWLGGNRVLASGDLRGLAPSPRGGLWVLGAGGALRVRDDPESADGWAIEERLPVWLSARISAVKDVVETEAGDLWLASHAGVQWVPRAVRDRGEDPPPVYIEALRVDGELRAVPSPVGRDARVQVGGEDSVISLDLSARSLLTPHPLRVRHRVDGRAWSAPSTVPGVELRGLSAGEHTLEVAASIDGHSWGPPRALRLVVPRPWWRRPWVWIGLGTVLALLALAAQRVWAEVRLREARARTRLAMDVHDELGAGLASLGLLGGLVEQGVAPDRTQELGGRIAKDAERLGEAVSAMVWSLGPEHDSLHDLVAFLEARSASTLPELHARGAVHVDASASDAAGRVDPTTLRALQRIGLEALTNIARHARASAVHIQVVREGGRVGLQIRDDGQGFDVERVSPRPGGGLGLKSMRTRGQAHGLDVQVRSAPGEGTMVTAWLPRRRPWTRRPPTKAPEEDR